MGNLFAAVGKVRGKDRVIMLSVGGARLDLDGVRRHFGRHPLPVKFDAAPIFVEFDKEMKIPLSQAVRDPSAFAKHVAQAKEIAKESGVLPPGTPVTEREIHNAIERGLEQPHVHDAQPAKEAKPVEVETSIAPPLVNPTQEGVLAVNAVEDVKVAEKKKK